MKRAFTGIAALVALVVSFAGVAFGLVALAGWPLPAWATLRTAAQLHSFPPHLIAQLAACVAWPCLAYLLLAVLRMGVDAWQDRPTRTDGLTAWLQPVVRRAVAVLVLCSGLLNRAPAWSAPLGSTAVVSTGTAPTGIAQGLAAHGSAAHGLAAGSVGIVAGTVDGRGAPVTSTATLLRTTTATPDLADGATYRVQPGDELWDIAGTQLHDPMQWREIWGLNQGRTMVDRDGGHRVFANPRLILPGWDLLMPASWSATAALTTLAPAGPATPAAAKPSSSPSAPIERPSAGPVATSGAATAAPAPSPLARARSRPAPPKTAPVATTPSPAPPRRAPAKAATLPPATSAPAPPPTMMAVVEPPTTSAPGPDPPPTMVAMRTGHQATSTADIGVVVEAGLVGAAILSVVATLRRRQAQRRPEGRRIRMPERRAAATELRLRQAETPDRSWIVERALPVLARAVGESAPRPTVLGVVVDDDSVEALLDRPAPAAEPWTGSAEGFRWRISADVLPSDLPPESTPLPALVSLGRVATGTADALINLEAAGLIAVTGDATRVVGSLYAMASHLVGAPWAKAVNVILVAFPPGLAGRDNVRSVGSLAEVLDELTATAEVMATAARQRGCDDVLDGRIRGEAGDGWPPAVVLCARPATAEQLRRLAAIARPGGGVAAVVAGAGAVARWEVDVSGTPCPVHPLRLAIEPTVLDESTMADIAELLRVAEDDSGATRRDPPYDKIQLSVEPSVTARLVSSRTTSNGNSSRHKSSHAGGADLPDLGNPPITVRVLGSVEIDGALEFKRAKSRELVVYLAMHPNGVGEAELDEALWASASGRVVIASTRDSTVSVARTSLGGAARLLPAQGQGREKRYQLGSDVQSDWGQFCVLHRFGRQHQSTAALRQALELVRGRPFEAVISGRTYGWIHTEGHGRHIEAEVADAADLAAALFLQAGDPLQARWAARRGLVAEPYTERLWVRMMEAADVLGESQEIERLMDEMDTILELDGDFGGLHPNTLAAYDRLSRRHRFPAAT